MKKKILFLCSNMEIGGFQKSLISLLNNFNYDKYQVDLLLLSPNGVFMDLIPPEVNQINIKTPKEYFGKFPGCIKLLIKKGHLFLALCRCLQAVIGKFNKGFGGIFLSKMMKPVKVYYDVAIDYNGQHLLYYMVDKIDASKKISYFHSDYNMWSYYKSADKKYYSKVNNIVTVSEKCGESLIENFPEHGKKICVIENIISPKTVNIFPVNSNDFDDKEYKGARIITVGRLCKEKGADMAIDALKILIDKGYEVKWYWVGPGDEGWYNQLIKDYNLSDKFVLLGPTSNPYDYLRNCDCFVLPSTFEGKSVAIEEAKVLCKPIVVTNFSTAKNQIDNGENGIITEMTAEAVCEGIEKIINDEKLRDKLVGNLELTKDGNASEVGKLYQLIEG